MRSRRYEEKWDPQMNADERRCVGAKNFSPVVGIRRMKASERGTLVED